MNPALFSSDTPSCAFKIEMVAFKLFVTIKALPNICTISVVALFTPSRVTPIPMNSIAIFSDEVLIPFADSRIIPISILKFAAALSNKTNVSKACLRITATPDKIPTHAPNFKEDSPNTFSISL